MTPLRPTLVKSDPEGLRVTWKSIFVVRPFDTSTVSQIEHIQQEVTAFSGQHGGPIDLVVLVPSTAPPPGPSVLAAIRTLFHHCRRDIASTVIMIDARGFAGSLMLSTATAVLRHVGIGTHVARNPSAVAAQLLASRSVTAVALPEVRQIIQDIHSKPQSFAAE